MKPMKTAAALRAGDTEFLNRPKLSETLALRAANHLEREDLLRHVTFPDSFKGDCAKIIASEFSMLDELMECLKSVKRAYRDPVCINFEKFNEVMDSASDLLERIEKGTK